MDYMIAAVGWVFWTLIGIVVWLIEKLIWLVIWLLLPAAIVAFMALRLAERALGPERVRGWVKSQTLRYGAAAWVRARRMTFALGVLPARVLVYFIAFTIWHSIVSLFWRPKWHPWRRAWSKRWRKSKAIAKSRPSQAQKLSVKLF